ncbi:MAG: sugar phosphate isomerase/epimerase family protein [Pseudomonadota bacterium]
MLPLTIGACLLIPEIETHRDWLLSADRDVELQDFMTQEVLCGDWQALVASAKTALDGHTGRLGIHGPFRGLDIHNPDPEMGPLITKRFLCALEVCAALGATQMVLHSPFDLWYHQNRLSLPRVRERLQERVHTILGPVAKCAEDIGVTLVLENIEDVDPQERALLIDALGSPAVALSIDTGHAHLARYMSGAPPVDQFVRAAGSGLAHVHLQDVDGYADRHWAIGTGSIAWEAVFRALSEVEATPHLVLELRDKADIPRSFAYLKAAGLAI